ncbi:MAG: class I SAM-dependent RNA methyltransferase, partial [Oscillospiraceae bacterium]|nr:class I SAM-dependent RNA methyltransferase [Oscillospiraceae bacterium]
IEAALRQGHIAPGLHRHFTLEDFCFFPEEKGKLIKESVLKACEPNRINQLYGSDINPEAIELATRHLRQAGLTGHISFSVLPLQEIKLQSEKGVFICNPPYGERLGDKQSCHILYNDLHQMQKRHPGWSLCAVSSDPEFEKAYGRRADKKRRLYNGRLECQLYIFSAQY